MKCKNVVETSLVLWKRCGIKIQNLLKEAVNSKEFKE